MEIFDFVAINSFKIFGACILITVCHINLNFGHPAIHNERICDHKHPKIHDVSLLSIQNPQFWFRQKKTIENYPVMWIQYFGMHKWVNNQLKFKRCVHCAIILQHISYAYGYIDTHIAHSCNRTERNAISQNIKNEVEQYKNAYQWSQLRVYCSEIDL